MKRADDFHNNTSPIGINGSYHGYGDHDSKVSKRKGKESLRVTEKNLGRTNIKTSNFNNRKKNTGKENNLVPQVLNDYVEEFTIIADIFSGLSHKTRLSILDILTKQPMTFTELLKKYQLNTNTLTYHLDKLGELGFTSKKGKKYHTTDLGTYALGFIKPLLLYVKS